MINPTRIMGLVRTSGPLDRSAAQTLIYQTSSTHQWHQLDEFHAVFVLPDRAYAVDSAGLESIITYLAEYLPTAPLRRHLIELQSKLRIFPKKEPEVAACKPAAAPTPEPRYLARIRTKYWGGHVHEETKEFTDLRELDDELLIDDPNIKNIKTKLERIA